MKIDLLNSIFVFGAIPFTWLNVCKLLFDKTSRGISFFSQLFFAIWGSWNIFYFLINGHVISSYLAVLQSLGNWTWIVLFFYYRQRNTKILTARKGLLCIQKV